MEKFEIGQRVRVLPLEELKRIRTINEATKNIMPPENDRSEMSFIFPRMECFCRQEFIVDDIDPDFGTLKSEGWHIAPWMCEPVETETIADDTTPVLTKFEYGKEYIVLSYAELLLKGKKEPGGIRLPGVVGVDYFSDEMKQYCGIIFDNNYSEKIFLIDSWHIAPWMCKEAPSQEVSADIPDWDAIIFGNMPSS